MSILEQILGRPNKGPVPVPTPEWPELDGQLFVRRLSPAERVAFDAATAREKATSGAAFITFVAFYCLVTADGKPACDEGGQWQALMDDPGSGGTIDRIFEIADEVNTLSSAARERLKKKSAIAPACGSNSPSAERPESR
jgi:hypothetical protein